MASHNDLGKKGEALAATYLIEQGYEIVARNYRFQKAEVDILARKREVLAVVEVKTRTSTYFGDPQEFITPKKITLLVAAVDHYVTTNELTVEVRFDIIAIVHTTGVFEITHLKDAFLHF